MQLSCSAPGAASSRPLRIALQKIFGAGMGTIWNKEAENRIKRGKIRLERNIAAKETVIETLERLKETSKYKTF